MATVGTRRGRYYVDFRYKGIRYREQTDIVDNAANRKKVQQLIKRMEAEITLSSFDYLTYFPEGKSAAKFKAQKSRLESGRNTPQSFENFVEVWYNEKRVEWSDSYTTIVRGRLNKHLIPYFSGKKMDEIDKAMIMLFRSHLAALPGQGGGTVSASCVNNIMLPLHMILVEAADRYNFVCPWQNIKRIRDKKAEIIPFSIDEVQSILKTVRKDFKAYYTTRFFTGMRTSEIDGLLWKYVDFDRRQILVREALVQGKMVGTKTDGSAREIEMNTIVYETLKAHKDAMDGRSPYVFSINSGKHFHARNVTMRVWYPLLRYLGFDKRRPYQTRHTAATLWLAAGENPEWIAKQMGHSTTKMLFTVYSRYVPNLTRQDGSAFERLLQQNFNQPTLEQKV